MAEKGKEFRDPIHGFIVVNEYELEIINSPVCQRLRNIKQLSLGHYVYHGSEHSRFGHTLGSMHLAGLAFDAMKKNTEKLGEPFTANNDDRQALRIAALLHDVGHTPFSHSLERLLDEKHELYSAALVDHYFSSVIKKAEIDPQMIKNFILGYPCPDKPYLRNIISGQLDVDRLDYLLRDSYYTGVRYGKFDLHRIIDQLATVNGKFVVLQGGYESVEQMIFARYQMYQQVYFHKTKRAFELMLWKCGEILKSKGILSFPSLKDLESKSGLKKYFECDDRWFLNLISQETNPKSVQDIAKRIFERKPYVETYSPLTNRKKSSHVKGKPVDDSIGLDLIETHVLNKLPELGIEEHEFLTDHPCRAPYSLMPNYNISDELDDEGDSIQIYYKNRKLLEPIEKRSNIIFNLAINQPFMVRGFVIPEKYEQIKSFLNENYNYPLPERNCGSRI